MHFMFILEVSEGKLKEEDILVQPLDLLAFESHVQVAETVIKYFKQVIFLHINNYTIMHLPNIKKAQMQKKKLRSRFSQEKL